MNTFQNDLDNNDLEAIFEDLSYLESLGLCHCLLLLKYYLDVPSYVNILKKLSEKSRNAIFSSNRKSDSIKINESIHEVDSGDDSIEVSQSRNYEKE